MTAVPHATSDTAAPQQPLAVNARQLSRMLGVSLRTVRSLDAAGKLPKPVRIGGNVRWILDGPSGIRAWLQAGAVDRATFEARMKMESDRSVT